MTALLSGRRLTALGLALISAAAVAAVRVALSGDLRPAEAGASAEDGATTAVDDLVGRARSAESRGDVAEALARYRAAVSLRPQLADRRSAEFLGPRFEANLKGWVAGLKSGRIAGNAKALGDASYLFRRVYGGCG